MASPAFTINLTPPPVSVAVASPVTALLDDIDGVTAVEWTIIRTDDSPASSPGAYALVQSGAVGEQVDTTSLIEGTSAALQCRINAGVDPTTGNPSDAMTTVRKFYVPTVGGFEVLNAGEFTDGNNESSPEFGAVVPVNDIARVAGLSGPPSGAAGGDLSGTYPNPVVSAITDGTATQLTLGTIVDGEHLVRNGANIESDPGGGPPSGAAGGDLSGTYPNPAVVGLLESGGSALSYGAINSGETLLRSGATVIGGPSWPYERMYAENLAIGFTGNDSPTFATNLTLGPFTSLGSGTYRVDYSYSWGRNNTATQFIAQIVGGVSGTMMQQNWYSPGLFLRSPAAGGYFEVTYVGSVTETFTLEFCGSSGGHTSIIWDSRMAITRVA